MSPLRSGGWAGRKSEPASGTTSAAPRRRWPQSWVRRPLAAPAKVEYGFLEADTRSTPTKRLDQMPSVVDAAHRGMWPPTAGRRTPSTPSTRRIMPWSTTGALSRAAEREKAARANTERPSVPTAVGLCRQEGGPPACQGVEDTAPLNRVSEELRLLRLLRTGSRSPRRRRRRRRARWRSRRGSSPPQRRWRSRGPGGIEQSALLVSCLRSFSLCRSLRGGYGGRRSGSPDLTHICM